MPSPTPDAPSQPQKTNPGAEILREARGAHATSQQLLPLLELLQEGQQEGGPLDELKDMLEAIMTSQRHLIAIVEDIEKKFDALAGRRKPSPSPALPESAAIRN